MTGSTLMNVLLMHGTRLKSLGSGMRRRATGMDSMDVVIGFAIVAGVVIAISLVYYFFNRGDRSRRCNSPKELFRSLCQGHELDRASRKLLKNLARYQRLAQPARLFLEPERFDEVNLSPQLRAQAAAVGELQAKLFAREETAT